MNKRHLGTLAAVALLGCVGSGAWAVPTNLLTNGDFETGTFAGWTVTDLAGGSGTFSIDTPGTTTPISGQTTAGNANGGNFYAVSDQPGPGTHAITQSFTVSAGSTAILSFEMFVNDQDTGPIIDPSGLNHTGAANQHGRVDLLTSTATPFSTAAADVLANFYLGNDPNPDPNPYTAFSFDITALVSAGGTYQIRFAEVDNQFFFNMGVDNVKVLAEAVPEPVSATLAGLALGGLALVALRRRGTV